MYFYLFEVQGAPGGRRGWSKKLIINLFHGSNLLKRRFLYENVRPGKHASAVDSTIPLKYLATSTFMPFLWVGGGEYNRIFWWQCQSLLPSYPPSYMSRKKSSQTTDSSCSWDQKTKNNDLIKDSTTWLRGLLEKWHTQRPQLKTSSKWNSLHSTALPFYLKDCLNGL